MTAPLEEGDPLALVSAEPGALATAALDAALDQLAELGAMQADAADRLQTDRPGEAFSLLAEALAGWMAVSGAATQACELTGVNLATLEADGRSGTERGAELAERLKEMRDQVEAQDTIALSDSLTYVWPEVVEGWQRLVEALQEQIEAQATSSPPPASTAPPATPEP